MTELVNNNSSSRSYNEQRYFYRYTLQLYENSILKYFEI